MSETDKPKDVAPTTTYPKPKPGQDDSGHVVSTAGDTPISGSVADITDGDTHHGHKKHK